MEKYFIYQGNDHDCGFAALKMLLAIKNKNKSFLYIEKGERTENFSFLDLKEIASTYNMDLEGFEDKDKYLGENLKLPLIVTLTNEEEGFKRHAVVIHKIKKDRVSYFDPMYGPKVIPVDEFLELYDGHGLIITSYQPYELTLKSPRFLPFKMELVQAILPALSLILVVVGFYFIRKDEYILLPIIFIALFMFSEIINSWFTVKCIDQFDLLNLGLVLDDAGEKRKERLTLYQNFKKIYFTNTRGLMSSLISISLIALILVYNDVYNSIPLILMILLAYLDNVIFKDKEKKQSFEERENSVLKEEIDLDYLLGSQALNKDINHYVFTKSLRKHLMSFIALALAIALMIYSKLISTNFIIFHYFLYVTFYDNIQNTFAYNEKEREYLRTRERILDIISINKKRSDVV